MPRQGSTWELSPHTGAKHSILRRYLQAWYPKLRSTQRVVFVDGFAGPGEYTGGEPGSPIIALDAVAEHTGDLSGCEFIYVFIEEDRCRYEHLDAILAQRDDPGHIHVELKHGAFAEVIDKALDELEGGLAPAVVMIDPFGPKGAPYETVSRLAAYSKTELLISFMYESINPFLTSPEFEPHLDALFGVPDWRDAIPLVGDGRAQSLRELYVARLREAGMKHVRSFEMRDSENRREYWLIFATHHLEGLKAIKEAMWKVDGSGGLEFSEATDPNQLTLFTPEPDFSQLKRLILERFSAAGPVSVDDIEQFVLVETPFRETHYKLQILKQMEKVGELEVTESPRRRRWSYPAGTLVNFL